MKVIFKFDKLSIPEIDYEGIKESFTDDFNKANEIAPIDTSENKDEIVLREEVTINLKTLTGTWHVPYARKRYYENDKNPQTTYYVEKALKLSKFKKIGVVWKR